MNIHFPLYFDLILSRFFASIHLYMYICNQTTQLPAYIMEAAVARGEADQVFVVCTQPRRIAAITVATRVAQERLESVGETVGYQVRLNARICENTRLLFCTTGVLLSWLQETDFLQRVSHVIVDEVHERQVKHHLLSTNFCIC